MTFKLLSLKTEAIHRETQDFPRKFRLFSQTTRVVTHCAWYVTVQLPEHRHPIVLRGDIPVGVIQEGGLGEILKKDCLYVFFLIPFPLFSLESLWQGFRSPLHPHSSCQGRRWLRLLFLLVSSCT